MTNSTKHKLYVCHLLNQKYKFPYLFLCICLGLNLSTVISIPQHHSVNHIKFICHYAIYSLFIKSTPKLHLCLFILLWQVLFYIILQNKIEIFMNLVILLKIICWTLLCAVPRFLHAKCKPVQNRILPIMCCRYKPSKMYHDLM